MTYPRPSAWALVGVLVVGMLGSAGVSVTLAAQQCTGWTDEFHPPTEIRVRLSRGPNAGTVAVVPFWDYVGTVEAAEYSTSGPRGPIWFRMGALAVKEYGWYYAMHWRGGTVTITNEDGSTTTQCYDVRDTTADQIYKPVRLVNGEWLQANVPSAAQLQAMSDTWHMSLRKWVVTKQKSRFFLTGYRSGKKMPCGTDADGFRIKQKSLGDCIVKGLSYEETQRRYYEPNVLIVDPRKHDVLDDNDINGLPTYYGDLGVLTPSGGNTGWRLYAGTDSGFADSGPVTGTFAIDSTKITGQGLGDVNGDSRRDLVMLTKNNGAAKIRVALATGTGYADPTTQDVPNGAPTDQLLVGDFDGDLIVDVGLLRSTPVAPLPEEPATLMVMRGNASGTFGAPVDWWRGALDLTTQQVAAGDVNGDGKADLVMRDATGSTFSVAPSFASCVDPTGWAFTYWGSCTGVPGLGLDVAAQWFNNPNWLAPTSEWTLSDYNRDGRDDLVVLAKNGSGLDVFGATATVGGGSFTNQNKMASLNNLAIDEVTPLGIDINPDGLGDLVLVKKANGNTAFQWLRAVQGAGWASVTYTATNVYADASVPWAPTTTRAY